jgi:hypothetical protein
MVVVEIGTEDRQFLERLDLRLRNETELEDRFRGRFKTKVFRSGVNLSKEEMARILGLANQQDYAIKPCCADGFQPGFCVYYVCNSILGLGFRGEVVLAVREDQFPERFDWKTLSDVYMQPRNRELLGLIHQPIPQPARSTYDY